MSSDNDLPKKQRRDAAREKARIDREIEQKRRRRNKIFLQGGIIVGVLAVVAIVALFIVNVAKGPGPGPANMASDGIILSGESMNAVPTPAIESGGEPVATDPDDYPDTINIVTYVDYMCPFCGQFEATNSEQIETLVTAGLATLEVHPLGFLDNQSLGTKYSTRASNAVACVANYEPDSFYTAHIGLFQNQPEEGSAGLSDEQILEIFSSSGIESDEITTCIDSGEFAAWVGSATDRALAGNIPNSDLTQFTGTPLVLVDGVQYTGGLTDAQEFSDFIQSVIS